MTSQNRSAAMNQPELTAERVEKWVKQISEELHNNSTAQKLKLNYALC